MLNPIDPIPSRFLRDPTMMRLLRDVSEGIRVLQSRDGVAVSEAQIWERARNIVMGLIGNYRIQALDAAGGGDEKSAERDPAAHLYRSSHASVTGSG